MCVKYFKSERERDYIVVIPVYTTRNVSKVLTLQMFVQFCVTWGLVVVNPVLSAYGDLSSYGYFHINHLTNIVMFVDPVKGK